MMNGELYGATLTAFPSCFVVDDNAADRKLTRRRGGAENHEHSHAECTSEDGHKEHKMHKKAQKTKLCSL